jgi:hypothetical protein
MKFRNKLIVFHASSDCLDDAFSHQPSNFVRTAMLWINLG